MPKAVVTGAAGFVGSALCAELIAAGYQVVAFRKLSTRADSLAHLPVQTHIGDINDKESLVAAFQGCDVVFHLAALYRQAKFPDSEYMRVNVDGTAQVLAAAKECRVRRVVYCSTLGVHGAIKNPPGNEDTPFAPEDIYQVSKCEAEALVRAEIERGEIECVIIRPAMIWGPGDTRLFKLFRGVAKRKMPLIGGGQQLVHWIHVAELARAFRLAAEVPGAAGRIYLIAGERPVSLRYTMELIARYFEVRLLPFRVPALPLYVLGAICEFICAPFGIEPPLFRRRVTFFMKSRAYDRSRAERELGFVPSLTVEQEVAQICEWYKAHQWL